MIYFISKFDDLIYVHVGDPEKPVIDEPPPSPEIQIVVCSYYVLYINYTINYTCVNNMD